MNGATESADLSPSCRIPLPTPHEDRTMKLAVSDPTSAASDDAFPRFSDDDATSDCDVICATRIPDEDAQQKGEELDCTFATTDNSAHEKLAHNSPTAPSLPIQQESDDVDGAAIVRVRSRKPCSGGSEVEATIMPVSDLAKDLPTLAKAKLKAVPVSHHFYNQWARTPRPEEADGDVTSSTRKPISMRMFTATGSLKSYTLMNAIMRDKRSPFQSSADLFQSNPTNTPPDPPSNNGSSPASTAPDPPSNNGSSPASTAPDPATTNGNNPVTEKSLCDTVLTKPLPAKSADCGSQSPESHTFPPIPDSTAKVTLTDGKIDSFPDHFVSVFSPGRATASAHTIPCTERLLGGVDAERRRPFSQVMTRKWQSSSFAGNPPAPLLRPSQSALSLSTASLLFPTTIDMRDVRCRHLVQKYPRGLLIKSQQHTEAREEAQEKPFKPDVSGGSVTTRAREVTRVEFIDFSEIRGSVHVRKENEQGDARKKTSYAEIRSAKAASRLFGGMDRRHPGPESRDRLNVQQFVTVGMTLPVHASADWHS